MPKCLQLSYGQERLFLYNICVKYESCVTILSRDFKAKTRTHRHVKKFKMDAPALAVVVWKGES